jgi:hypothetical protein
MSRESRTLVVRTEPRKHPPQRLFPALTLRRSRQALSHFEAAETYARAMALSRRKDGLSIDRTV